jgi:Rieske Fe-S protein
MAGVPYMCCSTPDVPDPAVRFDADGVAIDLSLAPALRKPGAAGKIIDPGRKLRVIVACLGKRQYVAMQEKCTHGGGHLAYSHKRRTVQCTCWGHSEFAIDGTVLGGPAKKPLPRYEVALAGDVLRIKAEAVA